MNNPFANTRSEEEKHAISHALKGLHAAMNKGQQEANAAAKAAENAAKAAANAAKAAANALENKKGGGKRRTHRKRKHSTHRKRALRKHTRRH